MGVSRRTLVRRLADAGVGYRRLADDELRRRAERLLRSGALSHAEIAIELGYSEPTSFSRACRRWFRGGRVRAE
jgi:AraC-like DNA-binding protein